MILLEIYLHARLSNLLFIVTDEKSLSMKGKRKFMMKHDLDQFKEVHMVISDRLMNHEDP